MIGFKYTVSVEDVICHREHVGWRAKMTIFDDGKMHVIPNTIWCSKFDAMHDADQMCEHAEMWIDQYKRDMNRKPERTHNG